MTRPADWLRRVNRAEGRLQLEALRRCVQRGQPYGSEPWRLRISAQLGLESTFRPLIVCEEGDPDSQRVLEE